MKRIFLFVLTNIAVVAVLGLVASLLGVNRYLTANGLNLGALLGYALVMGFGCDPPPIHGSWTRYCSKPVEASLAVARLTVFLASL